MVAILALVGPVAGPVVGPVAAADPSAPPATPTCRERYATPGPGGIHLGLARTANELIGAFTNLGDPSRTPTAAACYACATPWTPDAAVAAAASAAQGTSAARSTQGPPDA